MPTDNYELLIRIHTGFSQAELREMLDEARQKQEMRNTLGAKNHDGDDIDDISEAELLLKLVANLLMNGIAIPECLRPWLKAVLTDTAEGNDPRAIAYTQRTKKKGHKSSIDDEFLRTGTVTQYRISAIVQLLVLSGHQKGKAVEIVAEAILDHKRTDDKYIWNACADFDFASFDSPRFLYEKAMGNANERGEEFEKVIKYLKQHNLHASLETLLGKSIDHLISK